MADIKIGYEEVLARRKGQPYCRPTGPDQASVPLAERTRPTRDHR